MARVRLAVLGGILGVLLLGVGIAVGQITDNPALGLLAVGGILGYIVGMVGLYGLTLVFLIGLHELGHYLAGRAVGFRFHSAVAGPIGFRAEGDRVVRYAVRPARLYGFVAMLPDSDKDLRRRHRWFVLGGPVASLLGCGLTYGLWRRSGLPLLTEVPPHASVGVLVGSAALSFVLLASLGLLPGTLLPYRARRMGGMPTDMLWLWLLRREDDESRRLMASFTLFRLLAAGTPVRDLPTPLVEDAAGIRDGQFAELGVLAIRWGHALHHDPEAARAAIVRHAEIVSNLEGRLIEPWATAPRLVQAIDATFVRQDVEAAAKWLEGVGAPSVPQLAASAAVVRAGLAALRDDPNREALVVSAEEAVEDAARRTTIDWSEERVRLAALRAGWPARSS